MDCPSRLISGCRVSKRFRTASSWHLHSQRNWTEKEKEVGKGWFTRRLNAQLEQRVMLLHECDWLTLCLSSLCKKKCCRGNLSYGNAVCHSYWPHALNSVLSFFVIYQFFCSLSFLSFPRERLSDWTDLNQVTLSLSPPKPWAQYKMRVITWKAWATVYFDCQILLLSQSERKSQELEAREIVKESTMTSRNFHLNLNNMHEIEGKSFDSTVN
jgi:hypothetical protein